MATLHSQLRTLREYTCLLKVFCVVSFFLIVSSYATANLITNSDFESGNTGFTSDYTYVTGYNSATPEGVYSVVYSASNVHSSWSNSPDHTSGEGLFLVANGSPDTTDVVWMSGAIIVDQEDTAYRFEAWLTTVYPVGGSSASPILSFQVGDGGQWCDMGSSTVFTEEDEAGDWIFNFYDGVFSESGTYYVRLVNDQDEPQGNDFGIDDVYFGLRSEASSVGENPGLPLGELTIINENMQLGGTVPEPGSILLFLLGIAGLAVNRMRKRK